MAVVFVCVMGYVCGVVDPLQIVIVYQIMAGQRIAVAPPSPHHTPLPGRCSLNFLYIYCLFLFLFSFTSCIADLLLVKSQAATRDYVCERNTLQTEYSRTSAPRTIWNQGFQLSN